MPRPATSLSFRNDGRSTERQGLSWLNGDVSFPKKDAERLQKRKCIASKSEMEMVENHPKAAFISLFEVVGALFHPLLFHILKTILDIARVGAVFTLSQKALNRGVRAREP